MPMTSPIPLPVPCAGFAVEHLSDTLIHRRLIRAFSVGKNAKGLEIYLKESALDEEKANSSRTYLVTDTGTRELACYFSLRTFLVPTESSRGGFETFSAIELANFAVNESYRASQPGATKIGALVFLEFILPIARAAASLVGAQLLCVFALPERKLLDYYTQTLGFSRLPSAELESFVYDRVKQDYDKGCVFLYQAL